MYRFQQNNNFTVESDEDESNEAAVAAQRHAGRKEEDAQLPRPPPAHWVRVSGAPPPPPPSSSSSSSTGSDAGAPLESEREYLAFVGHEAQEDVAYMDPTDGTVYSWDAHAHAWFPKVDEAFIYSYQLNYGAFDGKGETVTPATATAAPPSSSPSSSSSSSSSAAVKKRPHSQTIDKDDKDGKDDKDKDDHVTKRPRATTADGKKKPDNASATTTATAQDPAKNTNVYVTGLPLDATDDEFVEFMSQCGVIKFDPDTDEPKIKLYRHPDTGLPKGDALCCYNRPESVPLALEVLDGMPFRGTMFPVHVEQASFASKPKRDVPAAHKKPSSFSSSSSSAPRAPGLGAQADGHADADAHASAGTSSDPKPPSDVVVPVISNAAAVQQKKDKLRRQKINQKLYGWDEFVQIEGKRYASVVIIKNMFLPSEFDDDPAYLNDLKEDLTSECSKCGAIRKLTIFDRNEEGVVSVKFETPEAANNCIELMNGRWFGGRKLSAAKWDGRTSYKADETPEQEAERLRKWQEWLQASEAAKAGRPGDDGGGANAPTEKD